MEVDLKEATAAPDAVAGVGEEVVGCHNGEIVKTTSYAFVYEGVSVIIVGGAVQVEYHLYRATCWRFEVAGRDGIGHGRTRIYYKAIRFLEPFCIVHENWFPILCTKPHWATRLKELGWRNSGWLTCPAAGVGRRQCCLVPRACDDEASDRAKKHPR